MWLREGVFGCLRGCQYHVGVGSLEGCGKCVAEVRDGVGAFSGVSGCNLVDEGGGARSPTSGGFQDEGDYAWVVVVARVFLLFSLYGGCGVVM